MFKRSRIWSRVHKNSRFLCEQIVDMLKYLRYFLQIFVTSLNMSFHMIYSIS